MATITPTLLLRKPAGSDIVDVTLDLSNNYQKIDNAFATITPTLQPISTSGTAGTLVVVAKADHVHPGPGFGTPVTVGATNSAGVATTVARSDHVHQARSKFVALDTWFAMEEGSSDYAYFYLPFVPTVLNLSLFGQVGRSSGPLQTHTHPIDTIAAGVSGTVTADHTHTVSGTTSSSATDHAHTASDSTTGAHSHTGSAVASHSHDAQAEVGSAPWSFQLNSIAGTMKGSGSLISTSAPALTINSEGDHAHTVTVNTAAASHSHTWSATSSGISANHQHSVPGHTHVVTATGLAGYSNYRYPQSVTVNIDGTDRTALLSGPFGPSQADWQVTDKNIQPYVGSSGWHYVQCQSTAIGSGGKLRIYVYAEG